MNSFISYIERLHLLGHIDISILNKDFAYLHTFEHQYPDQSVLLKLRLEKDHFIEYLKKNTRKIEDGIFSKKGSFHYWAKELKYKDQTIFIIVGPFITKNTQVQTTYNGIPCYLETEITSILPLFSTFDMLKATTAAKLNDSQIDEQVIENTESIIAYSNDQGILKNASISYAITEAIKSGDLDALIEIENTTSFSSMDHYNVGNPLRNVKNLFLSNNTLACRAAEEGGAPIVYVRTVCADFAQRIEASTSILSLSRIRSSFLKFYCQTVRNNHLKDINPVAKKCYSYLLAHLSEDISMCDVANYCKISYEYLSRIIKANFKCSYSALIHQLRINRACIYLHSAISISDVAERVGYKNSSQFCHAFRKYTGETPSEWKKKTPLQ